MLGCSPDHNNISPDILRNLSPALALFRREEHSVHEVLEILVVCHSCRLRLPRLWPVLPAVLRGPRADCRSAHSLRIEDCSL